MRSTTDTPPELIELREPEGVRIVDDDCVGVGNVDTRFDDGRADQHVEFPLNEFHHHGFEHIFVHLPVPDPDARLGNQLMQFLHDLVDGVNTIVDEESLAAALDLAQDHVAHELIVGLGDECPDR